MTGHRTAAGDPIGPPVEGWSPCPLPPRTPMTGRTVVLEPLDPARHAASLYAEQAKSGDGRMWAYMHAGPFPSEAGYRAFLDSSAASADPLHFAIVDRARGQALGTAAFMRMAPGDGVIEVGSIAFSPALQRSVMATEAMALMMARVFDELGYRRYEWKCNALNAPSRRAAERLGFTFEGTFRQHMVVKGRSRDTDWFSILDSEWPTLRTAFAAWLDPSNFDAAGRQKRTLEDLRARAG